MFSQIYHLLLQADSIFWGNVGFALIIFLGAYFTASTRLFQLRALPSILSTFTTALSERHITQRGVHPLKAFFASAGGMLGIGNIVGVVTAIQLGGPGALLWVWVAAFAGSLIKYAEIYLGFKHRVHNDQNGYDGGPMYFLQKAFGVRWISILVCVLLCIYGVEIYQFRVIVDTMAASTGVDRFLVSACLLAAILYAAIGGLTRVAKVCSLIMPVFLLIYICMCLWVAANHVSAIPSLLWTVLESAFSGHAAIGGFAGSTLLLAIQNGMAGASYSADIGIGYDSIIHSESSAAHPHRQARLAILGVFLDNFICTLSIWMVLITGLWNTPLVDDSVPLVQQALGMYFPFTSMIMPWLIFMLGYTTLISYLIVGFKCAKYLNPHRGIAIYIAYTIVAMTFFSFFDQTKALLVMRVAGALLLIINLMGIYLLRREVVFDLDRKAESVHIMESASCQP